MSNEHTSWAIAECRRVVEKQRDLSAFETRRARTEDPDPEQNVETADLPLENEELPW